MPNPSYGNTYDETIPTPSVSAYVDKGTYGWSIGTVAVVPTSDATMRFRIARYGAMNVRVAYQLRKRYSANAVGWDGGTSWTDWQNAGGTVDAWTELYSGSGSTSMTDYGGKIGALTDTTVTLTHDVSTYDAIQYRVQAWCITSSGGVVTYGSPAMQIIEVAYAPTFTATATGSVATNSLRLQLAISGWARGAQLYRVSQLGVGSVVVFRDDRNAEGIFEYGADVASALLAAGNSVRITAIAYPVGSDATQPYTVTQTITFDSSSNQIAEPIPTITDSSGAKVFTVTDSSYDAVTVTATWDGGSVEVAATLSGGKWTATILPPFNVPVDYKVSAYDTISSIQYYRSVTGTFTMPGYGYELRADDGRHVTIALEADAPLSTDTDTTVTTLASGRSVARHGNGIRRAWTLKGTLLGSSHSATSDWLDDLAILDEPRDLTFRTPYGEVKHVAVTGWQRSAPDIWDVVDVTVTIREVG